MKNSLLLLLILFSIKCAQAQTKIIQAKAYIDVREGKLVEPAILVIEDGLIKEINPDTQPQGAEVIDLGDMIILPGLMDMHVHLDMDLEPNYEFLLVTENASKAALRGSRNAELTIMAGFTTIRTTGQTHPSPLLINVALSEASDQGWIKAPRIIPSGHIIGITGGHADLSMSAGYAEGVLDTGPEYGTVDGVDEALKATRYQIKHGAKSIKIMATAGVFTVEKSLGVQQLTDEEMKTIVDEANRHDIKVAAHAHGAEGIMAAINAGVSSIEHGCILNDEAINLMKEKGIFLVPTTALMDLMKENYDMLNPVIVEKFKNIVVLGIESHKKAFRSGVKVALGTDAPIVPHGKNAIELTVMVKRGMKPIDAIRAATINCAELLDLSDRGEIKEGLLADIIAVNENPLQKIETLENVKFVMKGGKIYKQAD